MTGRCKCRRGECPLRSALVSAPPLPWCMLRSCHLLLLSAFLPYPHWAQQLQGRESLVVSAWKCDSGLEPFLLLGKESSPGLCFIAEAV